jgi:hypothetical protein
MAAVGPTWVRWGKGSRSSKWHKPADDFQSTLCGEWLNHAEYETKETYGTPVDEYAVCMRCWKSYEKRNRDEEKGREP